jgi:hypothetical protein
MALLKRRNNAQIRGPLSGSRMTQDACYDNGLNVPARLIARRILAGYCKRPREEIGKSSNSKLDEIVRGNEKANE